MSSAAADFRYHIDTPATWRPESAFLHIMGWLYVGPEGGCLDIRARVDDRISLGNYGLERPDLLSSLGDSLGARRSGFILRAQTWRGARQLSLDFHDGTQWREFFTTPLDTSALPAEAVKPPRYLRAVTVYQTLHYLYRYFHRESWSTLCRETDAVLADVTTYPCDTGGIEPFIGQIENPGYWINAGYDKFRVTGWAYRTDGEILQLSATTGVLTENRLVYPKDRPDVAQHRTDHPGCGRSGYYGLVDIRHDVPNPVNLKIFADLPDGMRLLAFSRRMYLDRRDAHNGPIQIYRPALFYKVLAALLRGAALGRYRFDSWKEARGEIERLRQHLSSTLGRGEPARLPEVIARRRDQDPYTRWCWHNRLTTRLRGVLATDAAEAVRAGGPLISVVVPAYNTPEKYLHELLACLGRQIYPRWELCIADDASPQPHVRKILEQAAKADPRIKPVFRTENGHISRATNSALDVATGDFIALVDHDDLLPDDALLHVAQAILKHPAAGYLYTDEDKIDDTGRRFDPHLKGAWSPEMAITHNYTHHLTVIRRDIVEKAGRLRPDYNGAQDIDLFLRCFELIPHGDVVHVPYVCYHWRAHAESTAQRGDQKGYLFDAARRAIADAASRRALRAEPMLPGFAREYALCLHQLKWDAALLGENPVTIVIPTKDRADLLAKCLDSLARTTPKESVKVVVVDDGSTDAAALALLDTLPARADLRVEVIRAEPSPDGFNYSRLVNLGTARADTPLVLHLNNDVEATTPGWLEDLVGWSTVPGVGVVGAKLLYPDGTVNHAGIGFGREDGLAHVLFERMPAADFGYFFLPHAARNVAAVTGACLLTRTDLYRQLGGFDEKELGVAYNDVDYCLRAQSAGQRVVVTPQSVLTHVGSASRGNTYTEREHVAFLARHGNYRDPYHSETLSFPPAHLPLDPYHRRHAQQPRPFKAVVLTHNLNFEGAPIFIFELARFLAEQPGVSISIASPQDGPLRQRFEALGLKVEIWDASALRAARSPEEFNSALTAFARTRAWDDIELFICNTMLTYWGVHLAHHLGKPSAFYIHESNTVKRFFQNLLLPVACESVEEAFRLATRVVFTARSTRDIHEEHNANDNYRTLPSWVDFQRIEAFAAAHDRMDLRRKHNLDPDAILVVNIGSVCERKGQHIYIRGIDLLRKELPLLFPGRKIQWVMVGAREGLYMESLMEDIQLMNLHEVVIVPETPDIYDFYRLADILVCTSFEESFPRVLLEAMVFGTRIVSTDVNGIAEMLTSNDEAYLVPAGDPFKLAAALRKALADHVAGSTKMTSMAYARAARNYHQSRAFPKHLQVIREAWLG